MATRVHTLPACALALLLIGSGCGSDGSKKSCTPGASVECRGEGGCVGGQVCDADGRSFSACVCGAFQGPDRDGGEGEAGGPAGGGGTGSSNVDGGTAGTGDRDDGGSSSGTDSGTETRADAGADAGSDAGGEPSVDFGAFVCNPLTDVPCADDERCGWLQPAGDPGLSACLPDGTRSHGQSCSVDDDGADDCERGLVCVNDVCEISCALGGNQCAPEGYCVAYAGLFSEGDDALAGACKLGCSAITQLTTEDEVCPDGSACFFLEHETGAVSTCAPSSASNAGRTQDVAIPGMAFPNSCAPGFAPITDADGDPICTAICTPVETWSGSTANIGGEAPHTCADRGAGAGYECRFASYFAKLSHADPLLNTIGLCVNPAGRLYDSNGNGTPETPWPSCADLAKTDTDDDGVRDHEQWGCAPVAP